MTLNLLKAKYTTCIFLKQALLCLFLLSGMLANGQNDYSLFRYYESFRPDSTGNLYFAFDNVNFFKNNEYKSECATGYTLTGAWLRPKIVFYPDKKLRMELGGNVLKYNGREEYYHLSPWFNVHYQPTDKIAIILGNLNSDKNHLLPEPLYDPERFLTSRPEAGLQVRYNSGKLNADFWIDWQQFIVKGDPFKERFAFGVAANFKIFEQNKSTLSLPVVFYGLHQGGEIDSAPGLAQSYITITPGISFKKVYSDRTFKGWNLNASYSRSTYPKDDVLFTESHGRGVYVNGTIETRLGALTAAYWHGHQFYTPQGGPLFQNLPDNGTKIIPENELLNLKYHFTRQIMSETFFGFVFDYYYDTLRKQTMNSAALYLIINFGVAPKRLK